MAEAKHDQFWQNRIRSCPSILHQAYPQIGAFHHYNPHLMQEPAYSSELLNPPFKSNWDSTSRPCDILFFLTFDPYSNWIWNTYSLWNTKNHSENSFSSHSPQISSSFVNFDGSLRFLPSTIRSMDSNQQMEWNIQGTRTSKHGGYVIKWGLATGNTYDLMHATWTDIQI